MLNSEETREVEEKAEELVIKPELMMENAGRSVVKLQTLTNIFNNLYRAG